MCLCGSGTTCIASMDAKRISSNGTDEFALYCTSVVSLKGKF